MKKIEFYLVDLLLKVIHVLSLLKLAYTAQVNIYGDTDTIGS